jgi:hypothetical protein
VPWGPLCDKSGGLTSGLVCGPSCSRLAERSGPRTSVLGGSRRRWCDGCTTADLVLEALAAMASSATGRAVVEAWSPPARESSRLWRRLGARGGSGSAGSNERRGGLEKFALETGG